jgi:hypothetical protein
LYAPVPDLERLRQRMAAAGVDLPPDLIDLVLSAGGATISALDELLALAPPDTEPFVPARQLPDDTV